MIKYELDLVNGGSLAIQMEESQYSKGVSPWVDICYTPHPDEEDKHERTLGAVDKSRIQGLINVLVNVLQNLEDLKHDEEGI